MTVMYKRQGWETTPWATPKLLHTVHRLCKTLAHKAYPQDVSNVFFFSFCCCHISSKTCCWAGPLFSLGSVWVQRLHGVSVFVCTKREKGIETEENRILCARTKCGFNHGSCSVSNTLLFITPLSPPSLITFLTSYKLLKPSITKVSGCIWHMTSRLSSKT